MRNLKHSNEHNPNFSNNQLDNILNQENQIGDFLKNKVEKRRVSPLIINKIKNKIKVAH